MSKISNMFGGNDEAEEAAARARAAEEERQAAVRAGYGAVDEAFGQFNDAYYDRLGDDYMAWALPQLERQHQDQNRGLILALSPRGTLNSATRARMQGRLETDVEQQRQQLLANAADLVNQRRQAVETARSSLYGNVRGSADPAAAARQAGNQAQVLVAAPTYAPLGQLLQDFSSTVADIRRHQPQTTSTQGVRIYGGSPGASTVNIA